MTRRLSELATVTEGTLTIGSTTAYAVQATCPVCQHKNVVDLKRERGVQKVRKCKSCKEPYYPILGNDSLTRAIIAEILRKARGDTYC